MIKILSNKHGMRPAHEKLWDFDKSETVQNEQTKNPRKYKVIIVLYSRPSEHN